MPKDIHLPSQLTDLQRQHSNLTLLDVRLAEDFKAARIPGAQNQCVFEVVFLEGLKSKGVDSSHPVCVYGAAVDSQESAMAAAKLERAGFTQVWDFRGGLEAWTAEGRPVESSSSSSREPAASDGRHGLDLEESKIVWVGRSLISKHWGHVGLSRGYVDFSGGKPVAGEVVLDMKTISSSDLLGNALHEVLIRHLESDDFFDVERYPETRFVFDQAEVCADSPGCHNLRLHGHLTLRRQTRPLTVDAAAGFTSDGRAALQTSLVIDHTEWGMVYGSGRFFRRLAGHLVNDHIEIQIQALTLEAVAE